MKYTLLSLLLLLVRTLNAENKHSFLRQHGTSTSLVVNNKPFIVLGGELGNSSASCIDDIERIFPKLQRMGLNTVLVPAYWDLTEPREDEFDFTLTDKVINQARENNLKVIFLWFGAWKNSMSCYAPQWFKEDYKKYPRSYTKAGKPLEIASAFSENVFLADNKAFTKWLSHIAETDKEYGTVIMIQIENEIGMLEDARDYSKDAERLFKSQVPQTLTSYLVKNRKTLHPDMIKKWGVNGFKSNGTWVEVFGDDIYTEEIFMAYYYASYIERMARSARNIYDVPLFVNAAMNSRGRKPGEYPSAGPLAHLIDVWHCASPTIDFLAPDLYDKGFSEWVAKYHLNNNPLFIPENRLGNNNGVQAFYVFGEHDAIGFCPFSIEDGSDLPSYPLTQSYNKLNELMPLITKYQGTNTMNGLLFDSENKERVLLRDGLKITARHFFTLPWDPRSTNGSVWPEGGGMIFKLNKNEYIVAGSGIVLVFENENENKVQKSLGEDGFVEAGGKDIINEGWKGGSRIGIASVDEVMVNKDCSFKYIRRLNGDQDHQGRHVRIGVDEFKILHVRLYEYK